MKCAADFRREARDALRGKWTTAVLVGLNPYQRAAQAAFYRDVSRPAAGDEMAGSVQETILGE